MKHSTPPVGHDAGVVGRLQPASGWISCVGQVAVRSDLDRLNQVPAKEATHASLTVDE